MIRRRLVGIVEQLQLIASAQGDAAVAVREDSEFGIDGEVEEFFSDTRLLALAVLVSTPSFTIHPEGWPGTAACQPLRL